MPNGPREQLEAMAEMGARRKREAALGHLSTAQAIVRRDVEDYIEALEARVTGLEAMRRALGDPETLARRFHDTYERLAPSFMYVTREDTRTFDPTSKNGLLMVAVCREILADLAGLEADPRLALTADDLAAVSKHLARTPLFLSDTHVRVDVALRAALAAEGKDET